MFLLGPRKRKEYKILLEVLPTSCLCLIFFVFLFVLAGSIALIYFAPTPVLDITKSSSLSFNQTQGLRDVKLSTNHPFHGYNQELSLMFTFSLGEVVDQLKKKDLFITSEVFGSEKEDGDKKSLSKNEFHKRSVSCSAIGEMCNPIVIFRERTIRYSYYEATIRLNNMQELFEHDLLEEEVSVKIETVSKSYTLFGTILRGSFCIVSVLLFIFYSFVLLWKQFWKYSKTEQKWIGVLLFGLIFFNNPFYVLTWAVPIWLFPIIDIFFVVTFGNFVVLFILVLSHSLLTHPKNRRFLVFYLPKIILVGINWILILVTLIWERFNQELDVSYEITENVFYETIRGFIILISSMILLLISFFIFKGVSDPDRHTGGYSRRFKVFSLFTLLVAVITGLDFLSMLFGYFNNAVQFLSFFPLYNYYCVVLALLFLPSTYQETDSREKIFRLFPPRRENRMRRAMEDMNMEGRGEDGSDVDDVFDQPIESESRRKYDDDRLHHAEKKNTKEKSKKGYSTLQEEEEEVMMEDTQKQESEMRVVGDDDDRIEVIEEQKEEEEEEKEQKEEEKKEEEEVQFSLM